MRNFKAQLAAALSDAGKKNLKEWFEGKPKKSFNLFFQWGITASVSPWKDDLVEVKFHRASSSKPLTYVNALSALHNYPMKLCVSYDKLEEEFSIGERYADDFILGKYPKDQCPVHIKSPQRPFLVFECMMRETMLKMENLDDYHGIKIAQKFIEYIERKYRQ